MKFWRRKGRRGKREEFFERWKEKRVRYGIKCESGGWCWKLRVRKEDWEPIGKGNKREPEETSDISKDDILLTKLK